MPVPRLHGTRRTRPIAEAVEAAAARSEKSERIVSLSRFQELTGFDRGTVRSWIDKGCPIEKAPGKGTAISVDIRSVWQWREEQCRLEERAKYATADDEDFDEKPMTPADRLKLEQIKMLQLKIGQQAELLVPRDLAEYACERMFGQIRQAVMAVPDRIFREMAGIPSEVKEEWYRLALGQCRAALGEGAKAVAVALPDCEGRMRAGIPPMPPMPDLPAAPGEPA